MDKRTAQYKFNRHRLVRQSRIVVSVLTPIVALLLSSALLTGCQIPYLIKSGYSQVKLLSSRVEVADALKDPQISEEVKRKLRLAEEAKQFAEKTLGLTPTKNYTTFVQLDRPYVTYVVSAAYKNEMKPYKWWFPLVGSVPYKGYFNPKDAKQEAESMKADGYDVYTRGVSAYSTLGWFRDPILSSMLNYKDYELVDTIIHETTHATIYIKSEADFNERLAVFFGGAGARAFYLAKEGPNGATLKLMKDDQHDERLFADFISAEIKSLTAWYEEHREHPADEPTRLARIKQIQTRFTEQVRPQLLDKENYKNFDAIELNNSRLLNYKLYFENIDDFEKVFAQLGHNFHDMIAYCKTLEKAQHPEEELAKKAAVSATPGGEISGFQKNEN